MDANYGYLVTGDLKENTLTVEMDEPITIRAGEYAVIRIDSRIDKEKLEEFIQSTKA